MQNPWTNWYVWVPPHKEVPGYWTFNHTEADHLDGVPAPKDPSFKDQNSWANMTWRAEHVWRNEDGTEVHDDS